MKTSPLRLTLALDGTIALGFGVSSAVFPVRIYGSIVQLEPLDQHAGTLAALTTLSIFYALFGAVAFVALRAPRPQQHALAALLALRHVLSGVKGVFEAGASFQVGSPVPDLVIHALFATAYGVCLAAGTRTASSTDDD